jgi:tellurite resistance protein TerC
MSVEGMSYIIFIIALVASLCFDAFVIMKKNTSITLKSAIYQYLFWLGIGLAYAFYLYTAFNLKYSITYLSAFLLEESLSIDNIFVFILLFKAFNIKENQLGKLLLIGILLAIVLRLGFITAGIALINKFEWILYIFGAILLYSGFKLFFNSEDEDGYNPKESGVYLFLNKYLRLHYNDDDTTFTKTIAGKKWLTKLALVVLLLAFTDIIFAVDSIPAVLAISRDKLIVFSSNIFAVLGLRALFFMLRIAANKFDYLQQGIAVVLIFIGVKLLLGFFNIHISELISFAVIIGSLVISIAISYFFNKSNSQNVTE